MQEESTAKGSRTRNERLSSVWNQQNGKVKIVGLIAGLLESIQLDQPSSAHGEADRASNSLCVESESVARAQMVYQLAPHVMAGKAPHGRWR